jgi:hypothetical protein
LILKGILPQAARLAQANPSKVCKRRLRQWKGKEPYGANPAEKSTAWIVFQSMRPITQAQAGRLAFLVKAHCRKYRKGFTPIPGKQTGVFFICAKNYPLRIGRGKLFFAIINIKHPENPERTILTAAYARGTTRIIKRKLKKAGARG